VGGGQGKAWGGRDRPLLRHKRTVPVYVVFFYQPLYVGRSIRYYPRDYYREVGRGRGAHAREKEDRKDSSARTPEKVPASPTTETRRTHAEHAESRGQGSRAVASSGLALSLSLSLSLSRRDKLGDTALIAGGDSVRSIGHGYGSGGRSMGPVEVQDCSG